MLVLSRHCSEQRTGFQTTDMEPLLHGAPLENGDWAGGPSRLPWHRRFQLRLLRMVPKKTSCAMDEREGGSGICTAPPFYMSSLAQGERDPKAPGKQGQASLLRPRLHGSCTKRGQIERKRGEYFKETCLNGQS